MMAGGRERPGDEAAAVRNVLDTEGETKDGNREPT